LPPMSDCMHYGLHQSGDDWKEEGKDFRL